MCTQALQELIGCVPSMPNKSTLEPSFQIFWKCSMWWLLWRIAIVSSHRLPQASLHQALQGLTRWPSQLVIACHSAPADQVSCLRYVSITMKSLPKEQLLSLTGASASGGSPRPAGSPKIRRPSSLGLALASGPAPVPEGEAQPLPLKPSLLGRGKKAGKVTLVHTFNGLVFKTLGPRALLR